MTSARSDREVSIAVALLLLAAGCGRKTTGEVETETHFLRSCLSSCDEGLSCVCGVCTVPCSGDGECAKHGASSTCMSTPAACDSKAARACDVECTADRECRTLGARYTCSDGRCRGAADTADSGTGATGASGSGGQGAGRDGGAADSGSSGAGGQSGADASTGVDASSTSGTGGGASGGGAGGSIAGSGGSAPGTDCGLAGQPCCDPFPQDGPNYCLGGQHRCNGNTCEVDCGCLLGAFTPVCGSDGQTYDATCGRVCVPVPIACEGMCPCTCTQDGALGCDPARAGGGTACCTGLQCCVGVPYDASGECHPNCPLLSDRNLKTDIRPADTEALLDAVARLPIHAWRYRSRPEASHIGPMAQDFAAELGLGADDRMIEPVDANGVALAAIQALLGRVDALAERNEALQQRITELEERLPLDEPAATARKACSSR